jgi:hypothetical protein
VCLWLGVQVVVLGVVVVIVVVDVVVAVSECCGWVEQHCFTIKELYY